MAVSRGPEARVRFFCRATRCKSSAYADRTGSHFQTMTILKRNLIANFAGSGWTAILSLAVLPVCLRLMGVEAYGLVGIFSTLLSLLLPFEAGIGTALSRDLAGAVSRRPGETNAQVVRTLEIVHW